MTTVPTSALLAKIEAASRREEELRRQMDDVRRAIARDVREARETRGLTLDDVGGPLGLQRSALSRLETGGTRLKFWRQIVRLARVIEETPPRTSTAVSSTGGATESEAGALAGTR